MATAKGRVVRYSGRVINIESATEHVNVTSLGCLRGHFCSDTIFNVSSRVL